MAIPFNDIPSGLKIPLAWTEFDNSQATTGPAVLQHRVLLMGQTSATEGLEDVTGTPLLTATGETFITADGRSLGFDRVYRVTSADDVAQTTGPGSMLHCMARAVFAPSGFAQEVYILPQAEPDGGVAAQYTVTIDSAPTRSGTWSLVIAGTAMSLGINTTDTPADIAQTLTDAVNSRSYLPVFASADGAAVLLTVKFSGEAGNAIDVRSNYYVGDRFPNDFSYTLEQTTQGGGVPDLTASLAAIGDRQFTEWALGYNDNASFNAVSRELDSRWNALYPYDGIAFAVRGDAFNDVIEAANSLNSEFLVLYPNEQSPTPYFIKAADLAARASTALQADPARPLQTIPLDVSLAPDPNDQFTLRQRMQIVDAGASTLQYGSGDESRIETSVTTYKRNDAGANDTSYSQVNYLATLSYLRYDWNTRIERKYPRFKLANDGIRISAGQPIVTPKTMKAEAVAWARDMESEGLIENIELFKEFVQVERDASNKNRLNVLLPPDLINQLIVLASVIQFRE